MHQQKSKFRCLNCGYCCTLVVILSKDDIERIKKLGYNEADFAENDRLGRKRVRMKNYYCYFLGLHKGESFCRIYNERPQVCRDYPFFRKGTQECLVPRLFDDALTRKMDSIVVKKAD